MSLNKSVLNVILESGTTINCSGNSLLTLSDPEMVYIVLKGHIDIFSVPTTNTFEPSSRYHFFTVSSSSFIFSICPLQNRMLVAICHDSSKLVRIPKNSIKALLKNGDALPFILEGIQTWLTNLSLGVSQHISHQPLIDTMINAPKFSVIESETIGSHKTFHCIKLIKGSLLFLGLETVNEDAILPMCKHTWAQAIKPTLLETITLEELATKNALLPVLDSFHKTILACEYWNARLIAVDSLNDMATQQHLDTKLKEISLSGLVSILGTQEQPVTQYPVDDPLFLACCNVGQSSGIIFKFPSEVEAKVTEDPLERICKSSHIQYRKVMLRRNWWKKDNGPLLGFLKESNHPVAIMPISRKRYGIKNEREASLIYVSSETNNLLHPYAYMFYPSLEKDVVSTMDLIRYSLKNSKKDLVSILILGVFLGLLMLAIPIAVALLFHFIIPEASINQVSNIALALIVLSISRLCFHISFNTLLLRVSQKIDFSIQSIIWSHLLSLPATFYRKHTTGNLSSMALGFHKAREAFNNTVISNFAFSIFSLLQFILLFFLNPPVALFLFVLTSLYLAYIFSRNKYTQPSQKRFQKLLTAQNNVLLQLISGITTIKTFGAQIRFFSVWSSVFVKMKFAWLQLLNLNKTHNTSLYSLHIYAVFILIFASIFLPGGRLSAASFSAFYIVLLGAIEGIAILSQSLSILLSQIPVFEQCLPILQEAPESSLTTIPIGSISGNIEIKHISFRYSQNCPFIIDDFSLTIDAGESIVIVGASGSGKSTLLRLLLGFESADSGAVMYDGQNINRVDFQTLRAQFGVVLQQDTLVPGTIYTNIVGSKSVTLDDVWEAAHLAGLDKDINALPMGMNTVLTEGGNTFSFGQKQRILLARALVSKPRILFLDDITRGLDDTHSQIVLKSLEHLSCTRVLITKDKNVIKKADQIVELPIINHHHGKK